MLERLFFSDQKPIYRGSFPGGGASKALKKYVEDLEFACIYDDNSGTLSTGFCEFQIQMK